MKSADPNSLVGRANQRLESARHLLGTLPDGDVAARLGVARKTIVAYRKKHGIPRYRQQSRLGPDAVGARPPGTGRASKLDAFLDIIGKLSDREVAEKAGMTTENVRMYRQRRGIVAMWRGESTTPEVAEEAPRPRVVTGGSQVYEVRATRNGERARYALLASDPVEAMRRAHAALTGTDPAWVIRLVRLVAPTLPE